MRYLTMIALAVLIGGLFVGCSTQPAPPLSERIKLAERIEVTTTRDHSLARLATEAAEDRQLDLTLTALDGISDNYLHDKSAESCIARFSDYPSKVRIATSYRSPKRQAEVNRLLAEQAASGD